MIDVNILRIHKRSKCRQVVLLLGYDEKRREKDKGYLITVCKLIK